MTKNVAMTKCDASSKGDAMTNSNVIKSGSTTKIHAPCMNGLVHFPWAAQHQPYAHYDLILGSQQGHTAWSHHDLMLGSQQGHTAWSHRDLLHFCRCTITPSGTCTGSLHLGAEMT